MDKILARKIEINGKIYEQSLEEHLIKVAIIAAEIGEKVDLKYTAIALAVSHDISKCTTMWQEYLNNYTGEKVTHSDTSSIYLKRKLVEQKIFGSMEASIFMYVIASHHSVNDIFDINEEGENILNFNKKISFKNISDKEISEISCFMEYLDKSALKEFGFNISEILRRAKKEMDILLNKIKSLSINKTEYNYYIHLTVRLLLSILKEADIYDSSNVFKDKKDTRIENSILEEFWENKSENIENIYREFDKNKDTRPINIVRKRLADEAKKNSKLLNESTFKAELPTGSGKTLLTMRYGLNAAKEFKKSRIFYVSSFLSVVEQNCNEIRMIIKDDDSILEHHSNVIEEMEYKESDSKDFMRQQYLIDSWESPIVVTTLVQFTNTLFKTKASNLRRFCKLIGSIVILDEIQNMPDKALYNMNLVYNFVTKIMKATVIHCTATQPELDSKAIEHRVIYGLDGKQENLAKLDEGEVSVFDRVIAKNLNNYNKNPFTVKEISEIVYDELTMKESVLVICNTKSAVRKIYDYLKDRVSNEEIFYLTTNQCARHRLDIINSIKKRLKTGKKTVVISTSLIEAGVDIDFQSVFRSLCSVSSLIQAAGRCNREGKCEKGNFYIFECAEEKLNRLIEIKRGANITKEILHECKSEIVELESVKSKYYCKLYSNYDKVSLSYPVEKYYGHEISTSILEMLSNNSEVTSQIISGLDENLKVRVRRHALKQSFKAASREFNLIEDCNKAIVVYYNSADGLGSFEKIDDLIRAYNNFDLANMKVLLKELQPYTINVRNVSKLMNYIDMAFDFNNEIYILNKNYYSEEIGLNAEQLETLII